MVVLALNWLPQSGCQTLMEFPKDFSSSCAMHCKWLPVPKDVLLLEAKDGRASYFKHRYAMYYTAGLCIFVAQLRTLVLSYFSISKVPSNNSGKI